ncbi:MAG TPA: ATP-binding protein, partial [Gemmatimonadaceae bacterium]|nr:ATP-binding protein [Gemmatimonadaceae bacterium]
KVYGIPAREVVGKTHEDLGMPPDKVAFWRRHLEEVFAGGEQRTVEFDYESPTFGKRYFSSLCAPERDAGGEVGSVLVVTRDVTAARRTEQALRESEERYRTLFTNMTEGFALGEALCDETGAAHDFRFLEMNQAFEHQSGLSAAQVQGRSIREALPSVDPSWIETYCGVATGGPPRRFESYNRQLDRHFSVYCFRPTPGRFALIFNDVSDRRRAEQALREADRRKDEFLGMLSHELRNPLAPIRNALYILEHAEATGQQARRAKEVANRQVLHLTRLVDDLLDVTRIARGKIRLHFEDLDLAALVRRTADDHRAGMRERNLEFEVDVPPGAILVHGDETRLAQVLGNLLHNAAKFTPSGGRVVLSARGEDDRAVVHVRDTGAGIDPDLLQQVFEPFVQAQQTLARSEGGLGLGLSLVKGLVALHGGSVQVVSDGPGRGTDFEITLPRAERAAEAPVEEEGGGTRLGPRHVLVVDDNRDAAETLAQVVELLGHRVDVAHDGPEALAKADADLPDTVLCDIGLPGIDGYEVARRMRARYGDGVRLIAVSGYAQPEDLALATEAGFDAHLAKPVDPARIEDVLR